MELPGDEVPFAPASPCQRLGTPLRRLPVYRCQVLVVGSGAAGLAAALAAAQEGAHVMVLSKGRLDDTNTRHAQGGLAAAVGPGDDPRRHAEDTLRVGCGLSEPAVVETLTAGAREAVAWLEKAGMRFDRADGGRPALSREGGHGVPRILHRGTRTGAELQRVLLHLASRHPAMDLFERVGAVELLRREDGRIGGLLAIRRAPGRTEGDPVLFEAGEVILATGGAGQIYRETTNPEAATGDGLGMAFRAGAVLQDLEFVQFHPTILYLAGAARFLISEVVRGEGGVLKDRHGHAFMAEYHPDAELAPRDVVSRAIFRQMVRTGDTHVYLDLSRVPAAAERFADLGRIAREFGIDIGRQPIPVRPAVHYFVGGVAVDLEGASSLPGLRATGECASTGFHGANRMGSNSLLEGLVHGRLTGLAAAGAAPARAGLELPDCPPGRSVPGAELSLADMVYSLKSLMWRQVGIEREGSGLQDALDRLQTWHGYLARLCPFTPAGVEVVNMMQVAMAVALCASFRTESRGTHSRSDHPEAREEWRRHTRLRLRDGRIEIEAGPLLASAAAPTDPLRR